MNLFEINKARIAKNIQESYIDLEKGKKANIGEIREWNGKKFQKQANGKWEEIRGGAKGSEGSMDVESDKEIAKKMNVTGIPSLVEAFVSMQMGGPVDYKNSDMKSAFNYVKKRYYHPSMTNEVFSKIVLEKLKPKIGGQWRFVKDDLQGTKDDFVKEAMDQFLKIVL